MIRTRLPPGAWLLLGVTGLISLAAHGPATLWAPWVAQASRGQFALSGAQGLWHRGEAWLHLRGSDQAMYLIWSVMPAWEEAGPGLRLHLGHALAVDGAAQDEPSLVGTVLCTFSGCRSTGITGHLPAEWLQTIATPAKSLGLKGDFSWQLNQFNWPWHGDGEGVLTWQSAQLYAEKLALPLGRYRGTIQTRCSGTPPALQGDFKVHSEPAPATAHGLQLSAQGQFGLSGLDLKGRLNLPPRTNPGLGNLLTLLGLPAQGGDFALQTSHRDIASPVLP